MVDQDCKRGGGNENFIIWNTVSSLSCSEVVVLLQLYNDQKEKKIVRGKEATGGDYHKWGCPNFFLQVDR